MCRGVSIRRSDVGSEDPCDNQEKDVGQTTGRMEPGKTSLEKEK